MPLDATQFETQLRWTLIARPFSTEREERSALVGLSLAQMLEASDLPERYWPYLQVFVDDEEIPRDWWANVRPKPNARLFVRVNAKGDGRIAGKMKSLARVDLLILDDWGLTPLDGNARHL